MSDLSLRTPGPRAMTGPVTSHGFPFGLTERQLECLAWVAEGKSASDIGAILGISGRTVERLLFKACGHFGVRTRIQAALKARDRGLIGAPAP